MEKVVVKTQTGGVPGTRTRYRACRDFAANKARGRTRDGRGEIVTGMVMMQLGANSRTVVEAAKKRLEEIGKSLPRGVTTEVIAHDSASDKSNPRIPLSRI